MKKEEWLEKNGFTLVRIDPHEEELLSGKWFEEKFNIIL
jgi:N-acetylglutamate synthase-like GNAT family acetyltransferase